ncbi:ALPHA/BETA-HYDROLASES SUPERFAMILY PROTEIN [Salix purpurea]|uniref:ALPHA/BETA-HYDROLASES SUPERFAMILY PROTEIN n=1 Tax=Salix purpurea TaxID=77065 RepID=A0A9Q0PB22_SALPP|nr:ALPHA/BETA-HYDROLASES SUPERFAMILY PROTEIN [Salix purpurea]
MPVHCRRSCLLLLCVYYLKTDITTATETSSGRDMEFFTLWRRRSGEHFQRTVLSSKIIFDHKCDCHYYALRDVLKGLPGTNNECIFR